ncbi:MAG: carboxypeptidase regulatory-like domain-containing protein [Bryobacterales bacterium]|nr:carboxypeptidase regulatory-like domain-containing protein [Bryobacterales bacterium]
MLPRLTGLFVVLLFALPLAAETPMTRIKVEVLTLEDKPIDRAAVVVRFVEGRSVTKLGKKIMTHWELRTNQDGVAKIPQLPQGKIRVQVIAKGYQTFGKEFEVNEEEKTLVVKLNPPQPQYSAHED